MPNAARRRATYQDVLDAPENVVAEVVDGVLETSPRPITKHQNATSNLGVELGPPFKNGLNGPGGWVILDEPELHLSDDIVVPDLAAWRRDRLQGNELEQAFWTLVPDWVCEALSPSTYRFDRFRKMPLYARAGVKNLWLVDAEGQALEVYRRVDEKWLQLGVYQGDMKVRAEPFDAIELDLALLWRL